MAFVDALSREYAGGVSSFVFRPIIGSTARRDVVSYLHDQCASICRDLDDAVVMEIAETSDAAIESLRQRAESLASKCEEIQRNIAEVSKAIQASGSISGRVVAIMPDWLRQRLDARHDGLRSLREREKHIEMQLDEVRSAERRANQSLKALRDVAAAADRLTALKVVVEALVVHVGTYAGQLEERRCADEALRAAEARRAKEDARKLAEKREWREWLLRSEHARRSDRPLSSACQACGNLLAYDGVCIHCSR